MVKIYNDGSTTAIILSDNQFEQGVKKASLVNYPDFLTF
jgi:hypothetical protein